MNERSRLFNWSLVLIPIALALLAIYPPQSRLKGGIDLVGGSSLLYEIDTTGMSSEATSGLSDRVMNILKRRVDPNGQLNLVWRPIGNTRLEIQMPRPPKEVLQRREAFESVLTQINELGIKRFEVEAALNAPDAWDAWVEKECKAVPERKPKLEALKEAYAAYVAVKGGDDVAAEDKADAAYEAAKGDVEHTSLDAGRLKDLLAVAKPKERQRELDELRAAFPSFVSLIDAAQAAHDDWAQNKGALEDPSDLKRRIRGAGVLEFRILAERDQANQSLIASTDPGLRQPMADYVEQLQRRGPRTRAGDRYGWFRIQNPADFILALRDKDLKDFDSVKDRSLEIVEKYAGDYYVLMHTDADYGLLQQKGAQWKLVRAFGTRDPQSGKPAVDFELDARGGLRFGELTRKNRERQLAILLDGEAMSHATIRSQINERGQITGDFTPEKVRELVSTLEAGSLPARLKEPPLMEYTVGPSLGKYNRDQGMEAALYGLGAVLVTLAIYYQFAGLIANVALVLNLLFTLAIMATLEATFTLPGIAGMILGIGMAVDANVLISERIREERARGVPILKALRLGYDKAFSAIFDGNLTGLITCVILGYVGSQEVKGFALTLGFGLATSLFTAVFVTRLILTSLLQAGVIKDLPMLKLIGVPKIDWLSLRRVFWPISAAVVVVGLGLFAYASVTNKQAVYDIEFLGGTAVQIELTPEAKLSDEDVRERVTSAGSASAVTWLRSAADQLAGADISAGATAGEFVLKSRTLVHDQVAALLSPVLSGKIVKDGAGGAGQTATFATKTELQLDLAAFKADVAAAADYLRKAAETMTSAKVQTVAALGGEGGAGTAYEIVTVETSKEVVQTAIMAVMGDELAVERPIQFAVVNDPATGAPYFALDEQVRYLDDLPGWAQGVASPAHFDVQAFKGGVAMVFDQLTPPISTAAFDRRIREIRLQPEFEKAQWRKYQLFGLTEAGKSGTEPAFSKIAMVGLDDSVPSYEDRGQWEHMVAKPELELASRALQSEQSLRKVVQFAPVVASTARNQAFQAILLSFAAIAIYVWFRFGTLQFGLAAVVALVHDVAVPLALISLLDLAGIASFRIDMAIVAALLTLIGYGLNDTIVIFDRIRENRGKLTKLSASLINDSLNQTLSRTIMTSWNVFITVAILFVLGGPGVRGFAFVMLVGTLSSTYTTLAIAVPLVYQPKLLHMVVYVLAALMLFGLVVMLGATKVMLGVVGLVIAAMLVAAIVIESKSDRGAMIATA